MARKGYGRNNSLVNVSTHADDGTSPVGSNEWNENPKNDGIFGLAKKTEPVSSYSIDITDSYVEVTSSSNEEIRTMVQVTDVLPAANYGASHDGSDSSKTDGASTAIKSFAEGDLLYLVKATAGHVITLKHQYGSSGGAGKITTLTGGDLLLDVKIPRIFMCRTISGVQEWVEYGGGTASDLDTTNFAANIIDTDLTSVAGTDTTIPSAKAVKDYVDTQITAEDLDTAGDSGTGAIDLNSQSLTVSGGSGITTTASSQAITIAGDDATTSAKGVASFAAGEFTVSSGAVSVNAIAEGKVTGLTSALGLKAPLDAPALTGTATAVNLTMSGDLTVNGTTTTLNTTNLAITDKNIMIADGSSNNAASNGAGITIEGGSDADKTITWTSATGDFDMSENVDVASTKVYKVDGTSVLSATALGTGVLASSLTSVGVLASPEFTTPVLGTPAVGSVLTNCTGTAANLTAGNATLAAGLSTPLAVASGGTTLTGFTAGDILYASSATALAKLAKGTAGQSLKMNSGATAPEWAAGGGGATTLHSYTANTQTTVFTVSGQSIAYDVGTTVATQASGVGTRDVYIRKIDANNEGVFTIIHKNGALVEVQIA